jgi:hypothetical protein
MMVERLMSRRVAHAFAEILPGLATQLRRHGSALARVARIGAEVAELLARVARRTVVNRQVEVEFYYKIGRQAQGLPDDHIQQRKQTRRHSR